MSTYTKNYKLIKPSYDEDIDVQDINNNMDVIDNTINGLNFVQNAYKDNHVLHLNKRGGSVIDIPLNYLPLTGGRLTGSLGIDGGNNIVHYIGPGGTTGGNLNLGDAKKTKFTALCCINRPIWWDNTSVRSLALKEDFNNYLPLTGGNVTDNITVRNNQVLYATNTITDNYGNYYTEYSDGSIVCGGIFTDLNQSGSHSGSGYAIETYARRVNYLRPITKTMVGMNAMLVPDDASNFWGNSSACAMLRKYDTTGLYIEIRSDYSSMLSNKSKCMWRAYFK